MKTQQRSIRLNEGIQLLRIAAMMMIIAIHLLGKGGLSNMTSIHLTAIAVYW